MALTRDQILNTRRRTEKKEFPNFGEVYLRVLTLSEINAWQKKAAEAEKKDKTAAMKLLVVNCLSDEPGNRLFKDEEAERLSEVIEWPVIDMISDECMKVCKLVKDSKTAVEETAKN